MAIEDYIIATDQELIGRVQDGDSTAFEHLFNRYRDSIYQLYMQRTGGNVDDTNDLLQETFVKVYLNLQRYSSRFTFGQWVYTIARNTFIDYTRRRRDDTVSIDYVGEGIGVYLPRRPDPRGAPDHAPEPGSVGRIAGENVAALPRIDRTPFLP